MFTLVYLGHVGGVKFIIIWLGGCMMCSVLYFGQLGSLLYFVYVGSV